MAVKNDPRMAETIEKLKEEFERLNRTFFDGKASIPLIEFSKRKTFGGYYQKNRHRIVLSWQAFQEHGWDETLNTFRHEVAHIAHQNHSAEFWTLAISMGCTKKYASNPVKPMIRRRKIYIYACPNCGAQIKRYKVLRKSSCARCDKKYNDRYKFKLIASGIMETGQRE
jgi:predicted SprT family Zn-dependent metalloprotease